MYNEAVNKKEGFTEMKYNIADSSITRSQRKKMKSIKNKRFNITVLKKQLGQLNASASDVNEATNWLRNNKKAFLQ